MRSFITFTLLNQELQGPKSPGRIGLKEKMSRKRYQKYTYMTILLIKPQHYDKFQVKAMVIWLLFITFIFIITHASC